MRSPEQRLDRPDRRHRHESVQGPGAVRGLGAGRAALLRAGRRARGDHREPAGLAVDGAVRPERLRQELRPARGRGTRAAPAGRGEPRGRPGARARSRRLRPLERRPGRGDRRRRRRGDHAAGGRLAGRERRTCRSRSESAPGPVAWAGSSTSSSIRPRSTSSTARPTRRTSSRGSCPSSSAVPTCPSTCSSRCARTLSAASTCSARAYRRSSPTRCGSLSSTGRPRERPSWGRWAATPTWRMPHGPVEIEPELVEAVLADTRAGEIELAAGGPSGLAVSPGEGVETAFLQLVLARLWQTERDAGSSTLRLETFQRLGGAERIVQDHLGAALAAFTPEQRDAAAAAFNHLVTPSGTKVAHGLERPRHLQRRRARASSHPSSPAWPSSASCARSRPPTAPATRATRSSTTSSPAPILGWRAEHETERRLAGERAEAKRRHRRLLGVTIASLVGLAIAVGLAIFALTQRSEAREQAALARASLAQAEKPARGGGPKRAPKRRLRPRASRGAGACRRGAGAHLARAPARRRRHDAAGRRSGAQHPPGRRGRSRSSRSPEIADVLRQSLLTSRVRLDLRADGAINTAVVQPRRLAHRHRERRRRRQGLRAASGDPVDSLDHGEPVNAAAFSPDGALVATASDDGTARLWPVEARAPRPSRSILQHEGPVTALDFGADGRLLATGSRDRMARIWDVSSGRTAADAAASGAGDARAFDPVKRQAGHRRRGRRRPRLRRRRASLIGELQHGAPGDEHLVARRRSSSLGHDERRPDGDGCGCRAWATRPEARPGREGRSSPASSARRRRCSRRGAPTGPPAPGSFRAACGATSSSPTQTTSRTSRSAPTAPGS